jgi:hypothetical protein
MGHLQLQHHDGDDDGDHAIAESRQPFLLHGAFSPPPDPPGPLSYPAGDAFGQPAVQSGKMGGIA